MTRVYPFALTARAKDLAEHFGRLADYHAPGSRRQATYQLAMLRALTLRCDLMANPPRLP